MLFNSLNFVIFFLLFISIYFFLNYRRQNILLLICGIIFYSFWNWKMIFLLLGCIGFNYFVGLSIYKRKQDRIIFIAGIIVNLAILGIFKYTVFFIKSFNDFSSYLAFPNRIPVLEIILPVGISFYTFHNISYLFDIYRQKIKPTENLITFSVYDLFFPLLLSGPIERPDSLIPQIESERKVNSDEIKSGVILIAWGIFKKIFVADNLSPFVNKALDPTTEIPSGIIYFVAPAFAFQVYADFSGYTDAARGMARIIGFRLSLNFNLPFLASNPAEFWKRWHISLSSWLRDYLYIPLGGNRVGLFRQSINLMIVWILGGLWHGPTYGYMIWGAYCGAQIVVYNIVKEYFSELQISFSWIFDSTFHFFGIVITFTLFAFGLLLFRVENQDHLIRIFRNLSGFYLNPVLVLKFLFFISPILIVQFMQVRKKELEIFSFSKLNPVFVTGIVLIFGFQFCLFSVFESKEFFYFQF